MRYLAREYNFFVIDEQWDALSGGADRIVILSPTFAEGTDFWTVNVTAAIL